MTGYSEQFIVVPNIVEIINILVSRVARNTFLFNTIITGISQYDKNVILTTDQGHTLRAHIAILAIPIQEMLKISFLPALPIVISEQKVAHAYYVTNFEAQFDQAHWQTNGFSGYILLHNPHFLCYPAKRNTLRGLIYHTRNDGTNTAEFILNRLNLVFGTHMRPLYWYQRTWLQSQMKAPLPGKLWKSIIFASSEFGLSHRNRMDGAVQAGQRAAILAILTLRPQLFLKDDAYILRPAFESGKNHSFWRHLNSSIMLYDVLFYSFVLTVLIASA